MDRRDTARRSGFSLGKRRGFALLLVVLVLAAIEIVLRAFAWRSDAVRRLLYVHAAGRRSEPHEDCWPLGTRPSPAFVEHDERGFRNPRGIDRAAIVAMGDSQTYGYGTPAGCAWPSRLGEMLDAPVYNMAWGSWGAGQARYLWYDALALKPEVIIYALYSGNDLYDAYHMVYHLFAYPEWWRPPVDPLADLAARGEVLPWDQRVAVIHAEDGILRQRLDKLDRRKRRWKAWTDGRETPFLPRLSARDYHDLRWEAAGRTVPARPLMLLDAMTAVYARLQEQSPAYDPLRAPVHGRRRADRRSRSAADGLPDFETSVQRQRNDAEWVRLGALRTGLTPAYRLAAMTLSDPRVAEGLRITLAAVDEMQRLAAKAGVRFVVACIPTKEYVVSAFLPPSADEERDDLEALRRAESRLWEVLKQHFEREGIEHVDTLNALRRCADEGRFPYPRSRDGHPNEVGYRAIAGEVASFLRGDEQPGRREGRAGDLPDR